MSAKYEEDYFVWLCAIVTDPMEIGQSYWSLLRFMHKYEFVWVIPGDANRAADGRDLRRAFTSIFGLPPGIFDDNDLGQKVSILEVLIALTKHAEFQTGCSESFWFRRFLENLDLVDEYDAGGINERRISDILYRFVWRTYDHDGNGGLFPVANAPEDQRVVEIWFQFFEYIESETIGR